MLPTGRPRRSTHVFRHRSFLTPDGLRLEAISADISRLGFWILFCGGSRSTIHASVYQEQFQLLRSRGYGVLAFDYRGFGRNPGVPSEQGVYVDGAGFASAQDLWDALLGWWPPART